MLKPISRPWFEKYYSVGLCVTIRGTIAICTMATVANRQLIKLSFRWCRECGDPLEYLEVRAGLFCRSSSGIKLPFGRCHFGTCCPKSDDTFLAAISAAIAKCGNSRATIVAATWPRHATRFSEHRPWARAAGGFVEVARPSRLAPGSTNQGSVGVRTKSPEEKVHQMRRNLVLNCVVKVWPCVCFSKANVAMARITTTKRPIQSRAARRAATAISGNSGSSSSRSCRRATTHREASAPEAAIDPIPARIRSTVRRQRQ